MIEEHKALVLQKYAKAWLARRRFQTMRRLVLNVQLSYRVQQLRKKTEEQVKCFPNYFSFEFYPRLLHVLLNLTLLRLLTDLCLNKFLPGSDIDIDALKPKKNGITKK